MIAKNIKVTVVTPVFGMKNSELPVEKHAARAQVSNTQFTITYICFLSNEFISLLNLFYTLNFILQCLEPRCEDFNGIPHPDNILVCCSRQCGTEGLFSCGGGECEKAPGGPSQCCKDRRENDGISTNQRVCSEMTPPPCTIGEIYVKMIKIYALQ